MLIEISEKDQMTHNRKKAIFLNNGEQYILKNTIAKFGFSVKIPKLCLYEIEYRANLIYSLIERLKKPRYTWIYQTLKLRYKKNLNSNLVIKYLNSFKLQLLLIKIFDSAYIKSDYKKLNLINSAYHIETQNKSSTILIIQIVVKSHTNLEICIYQRTLKFHKAFIILKQQNINWRLITLLCITHM